ncbi:MAG TPA: AI-2E family transporter [Methanosarcina sp.]|nr:AI-2E family transporter [Methanosarcina sp.]
MKLSQTPDGVSQIIASRWKIGAALVVAVLLCFSILILLPLADGIVLGLVFAYIAKPIQLKFKRHRKLGALIASLCIFFPIVFIVGVGVVEILNQISWIIDNKTEVVGAILDFIRALNIPPELIGSVNDSIRNLFTSLIPAVGSIGLIGYARSIGVFIVNFIVSIIFCFYILADGDRLYRAFLGVMPIEYKEMVDRYACHLDLILRGIFIGSAYSALIVSVTSVIVFYAFGFPHVLALATLIFIASVIPLFAGYMVLVPLALMRYIQSGFESAALFLVVSSVVIYGPPELILRPYLTGMRSRIHPMLLILAFLGGAFVGGIAGFFAAPILLGALVAAYRVYQEYIHPELPKVNLDLKNPGFSCKPESEK